MTRFYDRLRGGKCRPLDLAHIGLPGTYERDLRINLQQQFMFKNARPPTDDEFDRMFKFSMANPIVKGIDRFKPEDVAGVPVIVADDVARYCQALPVGTDIADVVSTMAPPFNRFFIDIQGVSNVIGYKAWGFLVTAYDHPQTGPLPGDDGKARWELRLTMYAELEDWDSMGPIAEHIVGLAEDGTWFRHGDGVPYFDAEPAPLTKEPDPQEARASMALLVRYVMPALMSISLMHCKNVDVHTVSPDEELSRRNKRRRGFRLVRYQVLDVEPMRRILDAAGATESEGGFRHALHLCRGHFKVFTPDAPLFGRHTGQYWWAPQVRGKAEDGVNLNDYRVSTPGSVGAAYRQATESIPAPPADTSTDPDVSGAGLVVHNRTQNEIARTVSELGWAPRSPTGDEPEFDLAWERDGIVWVCEVKSITDHNEEKQLRTAIGQVLRYRQRLGGRGLTVQATIATSRQPQDLSWEDLCRWEDITLVWPGVAAERLVAGGDVTSDKI